MLARITKLQVAIAQRKDEGVTAVEYGLLAALIAVAIITAVALLGTNLSALFGRVASSVAAH